MPPALHHPPTDNAWLFVLGREPELSQAELTAFFRRKNLSWMPLRVAKGKYLLAKIHADFDPKIIIQQLGGIVKIAKKINSGNSPAYVAEYLSTDLPTGKIVFSLNETETDEGIIIKRLLKTMGRRARYVKPKNTATILHNDLTDSGRDLTAVGPELYVTVAVQPFEQIGNRDYNRPRRDDRSGMLPPKLAMIMINLAEKDESATILDPFCGSGTIITEALLMGYETIIGSDLSPKAISDTKQNVNWIKNQNAVKTKNEMRLFSADARILAARLPPETIDAIVTEPSLGPPLTGRETDSALSAEADKLKALYLSTFSQFKIILKKTGVIIFTIPEFAAQRQPIFVDCLDGIKKTGFVIKPLSAVSAYLTYQRPGQRLARRIYKFTPK